MKDKRAFAELLTGTAEIYGQSISKAGMSLWWLALEGYDDAQVSAAFSDHIKSASGKWMPKPADIIERIDGPTMTADQVIGAALNPTTPLAVLCRIEIGSWNLGNWTAQQLKPYAERCIALMPEWKQRLAAGDIAEHEALAFQRHGVQLDNVRQLSAQRRLA